MDKWLAAALDYIPRWLEFQLRHTGQPGCVIAAAVDGEIVLQQAFGIADLSTGERLTPRHRFRVASHSKSFTAAAIMKLREQGRLKLDDRTGQYVENLHPAVAETTIAQLLSHSAGLIRDGIDAGQWADRRPFLDEAELRRALAEPPVIPPNSRFKYSNHAFGLAGLVIEAVTGERYRDWIKRQIVDAAGLGETEPDMPLAATAPMARGHSARLPLGRRVVIPGDNPTNALAPATGFVSTAADLARFFAQLDPAAGRSILSEASRREMTRPHWRDAYATIERHYGLGIMRGKTGECDWFGHGGAFQGFISQTAVVPQHRLALSIVTNTVERLANPWIDGALHIISAFAKRGDPSDRVSGWSGRWWSLWSAFDLVPMGDRVLVLTPSLLNPVADASELEITAANEGRIALATGLASHGESVRREAEAVWLAGTRLVPEDKIIAELEAAYGSPAREGGRRMTAGISLQEKFALFQERWQPKTIAAVNGQEVKLVKVLGDFPWHRHDDADEFFMVWRGRFRVEFRDRVVELGPGECVVVPRGLEHRTGADAEAEILVFEPSGVVNTGNIVDVEFTAPVGVAI